ncbi:ABC transporter permease [Brunnivagina elsteri]|uniref:ABC transporter permease n=1 Tax=Brunnivagina elsteri CCALA 953 TaxID=987040 RepID=A0A2A2TI82_9CYAN|nr:ABC transporter permease [Calothrix elsteri]PAX53338.1 ABC transporter permease [Calothrix elsteri CCALA 953]
MNIIESMTMAGKTLLSNRLRSALTMLGIVIGNASVIAMIGVGEAGQKYVAKQLNSLGPNILFVLPGNEETQRISFEVPKNLVLADAEAIASQVPTVAGVAPELNRRQRVSFKNRNSDENIIGTTPSFLIVRDFDTTKGRFFSDIDMKRSNQVVVLGSKFATKFFGTNNPIGQQIRIKDSRFEIIGVLREKGSSVGADYDKALVIPITTSANRLVGRNSPYGLGVDYIVASARDSKSVDAAVFQITNLLRLRHKINGEDDFGIRTQKDALKTVGQITGALTVMLAAIAAISLFVGGIGIMNIMLVSVTERTSEIGLRKAIGATQQDILLQFTIEAVIVSAAGGLVGAAVGVSGVLLVGALTPLEAAISPIAIASAVGISGAIGLFFGVVPARRAAKLDPIVALRSV